MPSVKIGYLKRVPTVVPNCQFCSSWLEKTLLNQSVWSAYDIPGNVLAPRPIPPDADPFAPLSDLLEMGVGEHLKALPSSGSSCACGKPLVLCSCFHFFENSPGTCASFSVRNWIFPALEYLGLFLAESLFWLGIGSHSVFIVFFSCLSVFSPE